MSVQESVTITANPMGMFFSLQAVKETVVMAFGLMCYHRDYGGCHGDADVVASGSETVCLEPFSTNPLVIVADREVDEKNVDAVSISHMPRRLR